LVFVGRLNAAVGDSPTTVLDYYKLLPSDYFCDASTRGGILLSAKDTVIDNRDDYLFVPGDGCQTPIEMALFRYHGVVTVAVSTTTYDPFIPYLDFLQYTKGKWKNVTGCVLSPRMVRAIHNNLDADYDNHGNIGPCATFRLPEHGTTIVVHTRRGNDLKLHWINGHFEIAHTHKALRRRLPTPQKEEIAFG